MAVATSSAGSDSAVLGRSPLVPTDHRDSPPKATLTPPGCQPPCTRCRPVCAIRCVGKWNLWWWSHGHTQHTVAPADAPARCPRPMGGWGDVGRSSRPRPVSRHRPPMEGDPRTTERGEGGIPGHGPGPPSRAGLRGGPHQIQRTSGPMYPETAGRALATRLALREEGRLTPRGGWGVGRERTVSRVLYPPGRPGRRWPSLLDAGYPAPPATETRGLGEQPANALLFGLAPGGVCLAGRSPGRRWALTPPFHPYRRRAGGVISVALSFGSPRLGVTQRPALRSPDFPPRLLAKAERPPVRLGPR